MMSGTAVTLNTLDNRSAKAVQRYTLPLRFRISETQNSIRFVGSDLVSRCQCNDREYPEPEREATQTVSPRQSIRTKDTSCSASQERTSNEMLPEPSRRMRASQDLLEKRHSFARWR
jgi:hypothetical protein